MCPIKIAKSTRCAKYGNKKTNGFDSRHEARRAQDLWLRQKLGEISELKFQVEYELIPPQDGERKCCYVADFVYLENGKTVVEDAKGVRTPDYVIKRKLMLWRHGIRIKEV